MLHSNLKESTQKTYICNIKDRFSIWKAKPPCGRASIWGLRVWITEITPTLVPRSQTSRSVWGVNTNPLPLTTTRVERKPCECLVYIWMCIWIYVVPFRIKERQGAPDTNRAVFRCARLLALTFTKAAFCSGVVYRGQFWQRVMKHRIHPSVINTYPSSRQACHGASNRASGYIKAHICAVNSGIKISNNGSFR